MVRTALAAIVTAAALSVWGCDCGEYPGRETAENSVAVETGYRVISGSRMLHSENYRASITIGDVPGHMAGMKGESYQVRLGGAPGADQSLGDRR